jgi:hypothetical protein
LPSRNLRKPTHSHHADEKRRRSDGHRAHLQGKHSKNACARWRLAAALGRDRKPWSIGTEVYGDRDILPRDVISRKLGVPTAERIFLIGHVLRAGFTIEEIFLPHEN